MRDDVTGELAPVESDWRYYVLSLVVFSIGVAGQDGGEFSSGDTVF